MGVCLSKAGHGHHRHALTYDEDGFCTPEGVSSQYESPNPSGRYSFANLETPRISADVGDLGALGSLFYKRYNRSRDGTSNYISPLDMFLGGVSGRNRVHHVNQICTGDYSFASYLASPLLKGFDVHAMEAVAKSYAESAAKAAARDAFVFLEENDMSVSFQAPGSPAKIVAVARGAEDCGDVDDDLAKSGESEEEWEESRKSDNWEDAENSFKSLTTATNEVTNERWVSVLNAVQARAKARRRQRRKASSILGKDLRKSGSKKTVRFQLPAGSEDGLTDDDIRSGKESDYESVLETDAEIIYDDSCDGSQNQGEEDCVEYVERCDDRGTTPNDCLSWQDSGEDFCDDDESLEAEFLGFAASLGSTTAGAATPLVGPLSDRAIGIHFSSLDSSTSEYFPSHVDLSPSHYHHQQQEVIDVISLDNYDEVMSSGSLERLKEDVDAEDAWQCPQDYAFDCEASSLLSGTSDCNQQPCVSVEKHVVHDVPLPAIPFGCVVVESRMTDGSRLTPQILELSDVELPERGENHMGLFHTRILYSGGSSPSGSDPASDADGGFSFPVLLPSPAVLPPESSPYRDPRVLWRETAAADLDIAIRSRSIRCHPFPSSSSKVHDIHEAMAERHSIPDDTTSDDPRCSFSFDVEQTVTKRTHEIVLPSPPSRSLAASPVFLPSSCMGSNPAAPSIPVSSSSAAYPPPRSRRSLNKKLKFYSLERASFAAGAKRSKSPPSFVRRGRRREAEGDSESDLFEIETMSGTNAMGSSRTPPSTPTKSLKVVPAASFDFERLTSSIAQVSRSRSKRNNGVKDKLAPLASLRDAKGRCLPLERRHHCIFQEGPAKSVSQNSLKGRALLKLGLLRRSSKQSYGGRDAEGEFYKSSETSGSEYLENKPPSSAATNQGQQRPAAIELEKASHNFTFEWYFSSVAQRMTGTYDKRQLGLPAQKRTSSSEDRTFAVKN